MANASSRDCSTITVQPSDGSRAATPSIGPRASSYCIRGDLPGRKGCNARDERVRAHVIAAGDPRFRRRVAVREELPFVRDDEREAISLQPECDRPCATSPRD